MHALTQFWHGIDWGTRGGWDSCQYNVKWSLGIEMILQQTRQKHVHLGFGKGNEQEQQSPTRLCCEPPLLALPRALLEHHSVCVSRFSRVWLWDPMDCSLPGSSVHGILQARILEWVFIPFSRGHSWPRDWTQVFCIAGRFCCCCC